MRTPARIAVALVVLAAALGAVVLLAPPDPAGPDRDGVPSILRHDDGGLRFTYHVPTGAEGLFDLANDPKCLRNLAEERPADLARLRADVLRRIGVKDLAELRTGDDADLAERLRALGYF